VPGYIKRGEGIIMRKMSIFISVFLSILCLLLSTQSALALFDDGGEGSSIGVSIDGTGERWDLVKLWVYTKPFWGSARLGVGTTLFSIYNSAQIPQFELVPEESSPTSETRLKYGSPLTMLPVSLYLMPVTWSSKNDGRLRSIYFYYDYWPIHGIWLPGEGKLGDAPQISSFSEVGIGLNPLGEYFTVKFFYRKLSIPAGDAGYSEEQVIIVPGGGLGGRHYTYHFPGYTEDFYGISIEIYFGCWE
jgi:hypothetical protein